MPLLSEISNTNIKKSFTKKNYRPWDMNDDQFLSRDNTELKLDFPKELRNLFGAQKVIFKYLLNHIEEQEETYIVTKNITSEELCKECNLVINTIKATIQKLKYKKFIENYDTKPGRGGFARYKIRKEVYEFFIKYL